MNNEKLHIMLTAANPVLDTDLGDSGSTPASTRLLEQILTGPVTPARGSRRRLMVPGLLGVAAAVTAAATAVLITVEATPPAPVPRHTIVAQGDAHTILLAAAERAARANPTGRYWHAQGTIEQLLHRHHDGNSYTLRIGVPTETWKPRDPREGYGSTNLNMGSAVKIEPLTGADAAAYRRDGSPQQNENPAAGLQIPDPPDGPQLAGDRIYEGDVERLPADPSRMRTAMLGWMRAHGGVPAHPDAWLFREAAKLLQPDEIVPQPTRITLYRMLAGLPGVRALDTVRDPLGRPATGVAMTDRSRKLGTLDWRLLISPTSDLVMATQAVVVRAGHANSYAAPGAVQYQNLTKTAEWTDSKPPSSAP
jgi:hypothetical protein